MGRDTGSDDFAFRIPFLFWTIAISVGVVEIIAVLTHGNAPHFYLIQERPYFGWALFGSFLVHAVLTPGRRERQASLLLGSGLELLRIALAVAGGTPFAEALLPFGYAFGCAALVVGLTSMCLAAARLAPTACACYRRSSSCRSAFR